MTERALAKVHGLLEPRPVLPMSTQHCWRASVMTLSWHTVLAFEPPLAACGNTAGRKVDKVAAFGPTPAPAALVAPPWVAEHLAHLERRVADTRLVDRHGLFVLEVAKAWGDPACKDPRTLHHRGQGACMVAGETLRLPSRMR